jgi:hypothetical protein
MHPHVEYVRAMTDKDWTRLPPGIVVDADQAGLQDPESS